MKRFILIVIFFITLFSCNNQKQSREVEETHISQEVPHIFHGMTKSVAYATLQEDGSINEWSEWEPLIKKYALYLDNRLIVIFEDSLQFHFIEEYLGKEEREHYTCYNIASIDQDSIYGYLRFCYRDNGIVQFFEDYPESVKTYCFETYMEQEEFEERINKYKIKE